MITTQNEIVCLSGLLFNYWPGIGFTQPIKYFIKIVIFRISKVCHESSLVGMSVFFQVTLVRCHTSTNRYLVINNSFLKLLRQQFLLSCLKCKNMVVIMILWIVISCLLNL